MIGLSVRAVTNESQASQSSWPVLQAVCGTSAASNGVGASLA